MKHRQIDSNRLLQRNKNLNKDIMEKQATEQRRTTNFLKFALGKREGKSEQELNRIITKNRYNERADPLMPKLFRKLDASKSTIHSSHKGHVSSKSVSHYDLGFKGYGS